MSVRRERAGLLAARRPEASAATWMPEMSPTPAQQALLELDFRSAAGFAYAGETLAILESMPLGRRVLHRNRFIPWDLFALASTRGIRYEIRSGRAGDVCVEMWRHAEVARQRSWPELRERIRKP